MAKRSATRNNDNKQKNPTKPIEEIKTGDEVIVNGLQVTVVQIDE